MIFPLKQHLILKGFFFPGFWSFAIYLCNNSVQFKKRKAEDTSVIVGALSFGVLVVEI